MPAWTTYLNLSLQHHKFIEIIIYICRLFWGFILNTGQIGTIRYVGSDCGQHLFPHYIIWDKLRACSNAHGYYTPAMTDCSAIKFKKISSKLILVYFGNVPLRGNGVLNKVALVQVVFHLRSYYTEGRTLPL